MEKLLNSYKERTYKNAVLQIKDERKELLDRCLDELYPYERDLIRGLCAEGVSEREYARHTGLTRYQVRCEKERILKQIASVFTDYFAPEKQPGPLPSTFSQNGFTQDPPFNKPIDTLSAKPKI